MHKKIVYLTIDDGPSINMKEKLDFLLNRSIPAIWFCRGDFLKKFSYIAEYAIRNGFVIGNHSYHHHSFSYLNLRDATHEIRETDIIINKIYKKAGFLRPANIFRFPYGDKGGKNKQGIQNILSKFGYHQPYFENITYPWFKETSLSQDLDTFWTFDMEEYKNNDLELLFAKLSTLNLNHEKVLFNNQSNEIILLHDHEKTKDLFFEIIKRLSTMKIEFKLPSFYSNTHL